MNPYQLPESFMDRALRIHQPQRPFFIMEKQKALKFEAEVNQVKCKVSVENEKEYTVVLKTMDRRAGKLQGEVGNWVETECQRLRKNQ